MTRLFALLAILTLTIPFLFPGDGSGGADLSEATGGARWICLTIQSIFADFLRTGHLGAADLLLLAGRVALCW